ncbi:mas-related G-protein coupled receptor member X1-like isoform X1 [Monodelphis domestica]|uniref:mas-related G-protein coupled receptor member X1-like isoform X1 n=1 Tax=Monodelphis domestica TaxID=13616 RepID=UPI0024E1BAFF|nr:mas-related G-protein coupled receptor member X1-like isoform X1 [Monodelphis domestica]
MAVSSPPSGRLGSSPDNSTQRNPNGTVNPGRRVHGDFDVDDWMEIFSMLITLLGLVGNTIVLWLLSFRVPRNPFSVYILNLAVADALYLGGLVELFIQKFLRSINLLSDLPEAGICVTFMSYFMGLSLRAAISTQRCLFALFPTWYRRHRPKHTSAAVCAVLWVLAGLCWGLFFLLCFHARKGAICLNFVILHSIWFFFFIGLLAVTSLTLVLRVQCSSLRRQPPRLYHLTLLTALEFLLCGVGPGFEIFVRRLDLEFMPAWLPSFLGCVNSSANPFVYFSLGRQRRRRGRETLRAVLRRALSDEQELGSEGGDTSHTNTLETSS